MWVPTLRGWITLTAFVTAISISALLSIHPFLAANHPLSGDLLIVEGWLSERQLQAAVATFRAGNYQHLITTGGVLHPDSYLKGRFPSLNSTAEVTAALLIESGLQADRIVPITSPKVTKDRTYHSALAVRKWLDENHSSPKSLDVLSQGPHARRIWLLFGLAMGDQYPVGIIAQQNQNYDPTRWWTSSAGVRTVIGEALAYGYAKFLFFPASQ